MTVINIFCDASIDNNAHIACGGCYIVKQEPNGMTTPLDHRLCIQHNATNNSAEILAIYTGVLAAIDFRQIYPNAVFRLFSDSKISLYGLRDWMKNWIKNSQLKGTNILISSSGQPVANQQYFINIFNIIVDKHLCIEFYHQRGHVGESGGVSMVKARAQFIKANKVSPELMQTTIGFFCECNKFIDNATRDAVRAYVDHGVIIPNTHIELICPIEFNIKADQLPTYIECINKTSVNSRHDFMGGYNQ